MVKTLVIGGIILIGGMGFLSTGTLAVKVSVNGEELGYLESKQQAKAMISESLSRHGEAFEGIQAKSNDQVEYQTAWISNQEFESKRVEAEQFLSAITPLVDAIALTVNGEVIATLPNQEAIDQILQQYKNELTQPSETNKILSADFKEEVATRPLQAGLSELKTSEEVFQMLIEGRTAKVEYKVQKNDSLWTIARKNSMLVSEILEANPNVKEDSIIQLGQVLNLAKLEPYITVVSKGQKTVKEVIPFDIQTKVDYSLAAGKSVVKQAGKAGEKVVSYTYTEENGATMEKVILKEEVTSAPVKQIVAKGPVRATVTVGTSRGSGEISGMVWPLSGGISSYYGWRGSGFHHGIDITSPVGTPYYAAADGEVTMASYNGSYGRLIEVDHGNGVVTRYAHSSQMLVSVGDKVSKGQNIGTVGLTGRTTGAHLHFEIRINGSTVNPLNYL